MVNGTSVLDVMAKRSKFGTLKVRLDGRELTQPPPARLQGLGEDDVAQFRSQTLAAPWHDVHTSVTKGVRFSSSNVHIRPDIGTMHAQKLAVEAKGLKLDIHSSEALRTQVGREHARHPAKYMHLNVGFPNGLPVGASGGLFAEMAHVAPMTQRTRDVLQAGRWQQRWANFERQREQEQAQGEPQQEQQEEGEQEQPQEEEGWARFFRHQQKQQEQQEQQQDQEEDLGYRMLGVNGRR